MQKKRIVPFLIIIILTCDFTFSFLQYYNTPLYGDIVVSVWPDEHVRKIFNDPLGLQVLKNGENQFNPNRYFSHMFLYQYFRDIPLFLQKFVSPISSVYLASALMKIIIQLLFIFTLASYISGDRLFSRKFLIAAIIVEPLFQVYGYWSRMGIVDQSIAYTFFYALPLVLLMLFFLPVFNLIRSKSKIKVIHYILLSPLIIILPFTGPLTPPVIILISSFIFLAYWLRAKNKNIKEIIRNIPAPVYILLIPISLLSLYSLLLGLFDSSFISETITLSERFKRLPQGLFSQLFHSPGFPLLILIIGINMHVICRNKFHNREELKKTLIWIGIFAFVYIVLLPFGGYRPYRFWIIRYDTFIPVNIMLFYFFGVTTFQVIQQARGEKRKIYISGVVIYLLLLTVVDFEGFGENECERKAFEKMALSKENIVTIPKNCHVMDWHDVSDYNLTKDKAELIHYWRITDHTELFYNEQ